MKKQVFLFLCILLFFCTACDEQQHLAADHTSIESVIKNLVDLDEVNVYVSKATIPAHSEISTWFEEVTSPDYASWFIFIDEHPFANWMHPCKYIFMDPVTRKYEIREMTTPPNGYAEMDIMREKPFETDGKLFDFSSYMDSTQTRAVSASNKHAVIISGGGDRANNHVRYWNDCSAIYSALRYVYQFPRHQIHVIMSDGTDPAPDRRLLNGTYDSSPLDLDGDGTPDIQYAATRRNLQTVFNQLANKLTSKDELFIYVIDHGGRVNGRSTMVLWGEVMYDYEFEDLIKSIPCAHINVVMGQCYSGGFIPHLQGNNRVIATACKAEELSYARSGLLYDEFVYHWTAAVAGMDPYGNVISADTNKDGYVSMEEAFLYAQANDRVGETPQYSSTPSTLGTNINFGPRPNLDRVYYSILLYDHSSSGVAKFFPSSYKVGATSPHTSDIYGLYVIPKNGNYLISGYMNADKQRNYLEVKFLLGYEWNMYLYERPHLKGADYDILFEDPDYSQLEVRFRFPIVYNRIDTSIGIYFYDNFYEERP
ncbi:MAG: C13 family peptidase [Bacteroides sp.]|nr:C13 family peptidase [Bacteroides sp.]